MAQLDFNQMLDLCWKTALGITKQAKFYQASSPKGLSFIHCIFRGNEQYDTIMVNCTSRGKISITTIDSPYMDDCVIHPPIKMSQVESEQYLTAAGYDKWTVVLLREPLYSVKYPPLYIYTVPNAGYIAVDSTNGSVFPLMGATKLPTPPAQVDLIDQITGTFNALVSGTNREKPLFSGYVHPLKWTRNLNCWATSVDMTGAVVSILGLGGVGGGTLITKKHLLLANHVPYPAVPFKVYFVDKANNAYEYSVIKTTQVAGSDIMIGELSSTVSDALKVYSVLPANFSKYLSWNAGSPKVPMLCSDQEKKALIGVFDTLQNSDGAVYAQISAPTQSNLSPFYEPCIGGDSGNPVMTIINGEPVLMGAWYRLWSSSCLCSHIPSNIPAINQVLATSGMKLKEANMSNFKQY